MDRNYGKWFLTKVKKAIIDYKMIDRNDRIAVGVSGGKDSSALLFIMDAVRKYSPFRFEMMAISIDMGWGMDYSSIQKYCNELHIPLEIVETKIGPLVLDVRKDSNPCSLCSKMRRGALDNAAVKLGCNKVALAHHADDIMETLFLNLIFTGRFATFEPKTYLSRKNLTLIRPLIYLEERIIKTIAGAKNLPVVENPCPVSGTTKRNEMKVLLDRMEEIYPKARPNILAAMKRKNFFI
ncbi:MAG: tRNA 2-thiocytidine(32) synthetase TtcA [Tepidanaerobacteraceae bacterium]|jgi:tRNA(Ile)-lysidine synthase TilS/MesJ|nr:tRNA 2-thiocytidine(32) synthetase TtcA [Tepidanaerobacteraceae bacterium]